MQIENPQLSKLINMILSVMAEPISPGVLIEFGVFLVSVIALFMKINANDTKQKLLINENTIKLLNLEKDILQIKSNYEKEIAELKQSSFQYFEKFTQDNREDHQNIFEKMDDMSKEITTVGTLIRASTHNFKSPRDFLGSSD